MIDSFVGAGEAEALRGASRRSSSGALLAVALVVLGAPAFLTAQTPAPTPVATPIPAPPVSVPVSVPTPAVSVPAPAVSPSVAAAPTPSRPAEQIVGIRVIGYQTVSPDTIAHYLGAKVGDPYDPDLLRKNFQALWDVGLLENISIEAEKAPGGVTLVITVEERPTIKDVQFEGNKKFSTSQLKDKLKEAKTEIRTGVPLSLRDVAKARSAIADNYAENGYRSATVDFRIDDVSKTEKKVVFLIDEGDKIKIASIHFQGNHVLPEWRLRQAMKKTKVNTWFRLLSENSTTYSQANYDADVENLKGAYQAKGYKNVVIKDPILDIYVKNPQAKQKKQKKRVRITIPVVEGDQFFTNSIDIVRVNQSGQPEEGGDFVFPKASMLKELKELPPGSVLNHDLLIDGLSRIESRYKAHGYIYWFADPVYTEVANHRVDVVVRLFEGDKFYLGRLEVQGNSTTRDKVIRREFALDEGAVMDMDAVKKSLLKLQQLGYFKVAEEPDFAVRQAEKKVDLTLKGTETNRNEIQFGAGYSALDGLFGQFSFQTRNFLGRGETLAASAQIGNVSTYYNLSYTIPWFLDRNQSIGASVYRTDLNYLNIDERRTGGNVFFGKGIGLFDAWSMVYLYEDVNASFPVSGAPIPPGQPLPPNKFTQVLGQTSAVTPGYRYDSRNDPFDPNRGFRFSLSSEVATGLLGGHTDFIKPLAVASGYVNLGFPRHAYLGFNLEGGWIRTYSGQDIPIYERFQSGGEQSLRGFRTGAVLPLDKNHQVFTDNEGHILGGDKYFVFNLEYVFASAGPAKLLAFTDVGNVYHESQSFDLTNVRSSVGLELRVFLPIFQAPLRFIYSWNLHPITPIDQFGFPITSLQDKRSGFDFSIGRSF